MDRAYYYVAEDHELPFIGKMYHGIKDADEAIRKYHSIVPASSQTIPSIGINFQYDQGKRFPEVHSFDLFYRNTIFLDTFYYLNPRVTENPEVQRLTADLIVRFPDAILYGKMPRDIEDLLPAARKRLESPGPKDEAAKDYDAEQDVFKGRIYHIGIDTWVFRVEEGTGRLYGDTVTENRGYSLHVRDFGNGIFSFKCDSAGKRYSWDPSLAYEGSIDVISKDMLGIDKNPGLSEVQLVGEAFPHVYRGRKR